MFKLHSSSWILKLLFQLLSWFFRKFAADVTRRDVQRQRDSEAKLKSIHNAKRTVSSSIAQQQQERSNSEADRNAQRLDALRMRTQRREEIVAQREREIHDTIRRRQVSGYMRPYFFPASKVLESQQRSSDTALQSYARLNSEWST